MGSGPPRIDAAGSVERLLDVLDLEQLEVDLFRGRGPATEFQRVFGGQVAGQALVAGASTVGAGRPVHSLHGYFLRPGDASAPIVYQVERLRDGASFSSRRVAALQHGEIIFTLAASFQLSQRGIDHQVAPPDAPSAETCPVSPSPFWLLGAPGDDLEWRHIPPVPSEHPPSTIAPSQVWFRARSRLPDDPLLHVCVSTYASDLWLLDTALLAHSVRPDDPAVRRASLDHAMWFHRPFRADEWILYTSVSPSASGGRVLVRGEMHSRGGDLIASVVQEGLVRAD